LGAKPFTRLRLRPVYHCRRLPGREKQSRKFPVLKNGCIVPENLILKNNHSGDDRLRKSQNLIISGLSPGRAMFEVASFEAIPKKLHLYFSFENNYNIVHHSMTYKYL
jgi:hypothetical protein